MSRANRLLLPITIGLASAALAQTLPKPLPAPASQDAKMKWFREAKFGLFIHWGLYAIPAGEWKGQPIAGIGEWIMNRAKIPVAEYELLAKQFNPVKFDAEAWVKLAEDAGMKYIVITSKHHDGFAMYHSLVSKYNVYDATPFHRDPRNSRSPAPATKSNSASTTRRRRTGTNLTAPATPGTSALTIRKTMISISARRPSRRSKRSSRTMAPCA